MRQVALFRLDDEPFAVPGEVVAHIILTPRLFEMPLVCPEVHAVFVRDGQPAYLLDLLNIYDLAGATDREAIEHVLVCRSETGLVGLPATRIERIVANNAGEMEETGQDDFARTRYNFVLNATKFKLVDIDALVATLLR